MLLLTPVAKAEWLGDARPMMGTEVSVWFWSDDAESDNALVEAVFAEASRIDRLMSTYRDESKISEINRDAAEHPVAAGSELYELIEKSIEVSRLTDGAFDITYESVASITTSVSANGRIATPLRASWRRLTTVSLNSMTKRVRSGSQRPVFVSTWVALRRGMLSSAALRSSGHTASPVRW